MNPGWSGLQSCSVSFGKLQVSSSFCFSSFSWFDPLISLEVHPKKPANPITNQYIEILPSVVLPVYPQKKNSSSSYPEGGPNISGPQVRFSLSKLGSKSAAGAPSAPGAKRLRWRWGGNSQHPARPHARMSRQRWGLYPPATPCRKKWG